MNLDAELRRLLVSVAREMYDRRYVIATEGNLSCRLNAERLLVTPTALSKGVLAEDDLVVTDLKGRKLDGKRDPTTEIELHLKVYQERPDVNAVIHAHPPIAIACTVAGVEIAKHTLPELIVVFGDIPVAPYATPGPGGGLAQTIEGLIRHSSAVLLDKHGSLTTGRTPIEAYENLERVEWAAEITLWAKLMGRVDTLAPEEVERLMRLRQRATARRY